MALVLKRIKGRLYWYQQWYEIDPLTGKRKRKPTSRYIGPLGNPWGFSRTEMTRMTLGVLSLAIKLANGTERYNPWTVPIHKAIGVPYRPHDAWAKERSRMPQGTWDTYVSHLSYAHSIYPSWELAEHVAKKDLDGIRERADAEEKKAQEWVEFKDKYYSLPESKRDAWLAAQSDDEPVESEPARAAPVSAPVSAPVLETPAAPPQSAPAPPAEAPEVDDVEISSSEPDQQDAQSDFDDGETESESVL
jgi:hypothetical protein